MMEHTTDRLFWTLSAIIIAALLLTLGVKIFPKATQEVIAPMSGLVRQADSSVNSTGQATNSANLANSINTSNNGTISANNTNLSNGTTADGTVNQATSDALVSQNNKIVDLQNAVTKLNQQNTLYGSSITTLQNNLEQANAKNNALNTQLQQALSDASNNKQLSSGQIADLQAKNSDLYTKITQLNNAASAQAQQYQQQINTIQNQLQNAMNSSSADKDQKIASLTQALNDANNKLQSLSDSVTSSNNSTQNTLAQMQANIKNNSTAITSNTNNVQQLSNNVNNLQNTTSSAQAIANTANTQAVNNASLISNLQTNLGNLQGQLNQALLFKGNITNYSSDFNTITQSGIYNLMGKWYSDFQNGPTYNVDGPSYGKAGGLQLEVTNTDVGGIKQVLTATNDTYTRTFFNNTWSDWKSDTDKANTLQSIQPGEDLLDKATGKYILDGNPSWFKNMPPTSSWLNTLTVTTYKSWSGVYVKALEIDNADGEHWYRNASSGKDTGWQKDANQANVDSLNTQISQLQSQINSIQGQVTQNTNNITTLQGLTASLQQNSLQYQPMPADGTSVRNITKPGIYVFDGNPQEHKWTDFPSIQSGWYNILVVVSGQSNPSNGDQLSQYDNGHLANVVHQTFITGGYTWDNTGISQRTFNTASNKADQYAWQNPASQSDVSNAVSNEDAKTLSVKGKLQDYGKDFNNFTENGIFSMGGAWASDWTNGPDYDANSGPSYGRPGGIMLVNQAIPGANNGTDIVQTITTTNGTYSRTRFNGTWSQWARTDSTFGYQNYTFTSGTDILSAYYKPSGFYHVTGDFVNTPDGFGGYGTLTKTQSSDYDQTLTLNDAQGNVWTNVYGNGAWQGWNKGNSGSSYINNNDDLNNYIKTGDYDSFNATGLNNSPYSYSLWFQLHVQTGAAFTTQTLTSSWGDTWIRTLSGSPAGWSQWVRVATSADIAGLQNGVSSAQSLASTAINNAQNAQNTANTANNTANNAQSTANAAVKNAQNAQSTADSNQSQISSNQNAINTLNNQVGNLQNNLNSAVTYQGVLPINSSFNMGAGYTIYDLQNQPWQNFPYAYYSGNGLMVETLSDGTNGRQFVWSTGDGNTPRLSYRIQTNGVWGRWILVASIDDVNAHQ